MLLSGMSWPFLFFTPSELIAAYVGSGWKRYGDILLPLHGVRFDPLSSDYLITWTFAAGSASMFFLLLVFVLGVSNSLRMFLSWLLFIHFGTSPRDSQSCLRSPFSDHLLLTLNMWHGIACHLST